MSLWVDSPLGQEGKDGSLEEKVTVVCPVPYRLNPRPGEPCATPPSVSALWFFEALSTASTL